MHRHSGSTIKYSFFFEKEQLVRDSFEIKGLGYIEWLEARLPSRVDVGQASKRAGERSGRRLSE